MAAVIPDLDAFIAWLQGTDLVAANRVRRDLLLQKAKHYTVFVAEKLVSVVVGHVLGSINPVTMALAPWLGAKAVYDIGSLQERLYALDFDRDGRLYAAKLGLVRDKGDDDPYPCTCSAIHLDAAKKVQAATCADVRKYVVNKLDAKAASKAVAIFTIGVGSTLYHGIKRAYKSASGTRGVHRAFYSQSLRAQARPTLRETTSDELRGSGIDRSELKYMPAQRGCRKAQATIAVLLDDLKDMAKPEQDVAKYASTVMVLLQSNGWELLLPRMKSNPLNPF